MSGRDEKAKRYITSLDHARCNGNWSELPELIRKVTKHAPQRKILIQTATAESDVTRAVCLRSAGPSSITERIPQLVSTIKAEEGSPEEEFQAQTCLGWIHWVLGEPRNAIESLPNDLTPIIRRFSEAGKTTSEWTEACLLKAAYIQGAALVRTGRQEQALQTFKSVTTWTKVSQEKALVQPQLSYWSEQLLAQTALAYMKEVDFRKPDSSRVGEALHAFRSWAKFAVGSKEVPPETYGNTSAHLPRLTVWKADYQFLSNVLRHCLNYPVTTSDPAMSNQADELRRVGVMYEKELLRITPFPKATDSNAVIEEWVEEVVENWQALCSKQLSSGILDESGRNAAGRNVLDVLYRAAMKTFHSTLILRRLFQVHKSLTEFDLAYRALDTYVELIERGRARAAKSEETATGQDNDETVLRTVADGIEGLCSFGRQDEAEKAYKLSEKLQNWIHQLLPESEESPKVNGHSNGNIEGLSAEKTAISPETLEIVYRAIGIGRAQWARWTPFNENRGVLQIEALASLKKAAIQHTSSDRHTESVYALGMLLAEMRDVNQAIDYVKKSLVSEGSNAGRSPTFALECSLIPLWHLLALLLTARQDFQLASQSCEAAFGQFAPSSVLLGGRVSDLLSSKSSTDKTSIMEDHHRGLVDDMECTELQQIIEIRLTELALTELTGGPEEGVNRSNELLGLFSRLFGHLGVGTEEKTAPKSLDPPKSSATTVRSFRGSVFGRKKMDRLNDSKEIPEGIEDNSLTRPSTQATEAPTIQVTDEHGKSPTHKHHLFRKSDDQTHRNSRHSTKGHGREGSVTKFTRSQSKDRRPDPEKGPESSQHQYFETTKEQAGTNGTTDRSLLPSDADKSYLTPQHTTDDVPAPPTALTSQSSPEAKGSIPHSNDGSATNELNHTPSAGLNDRPLSRQTSLSQMSTPTSRFSKSAAQKHALALLIKLWLAIATLYRRAQLFDDAREACDEAAKTAQRMETIIANLESSARAFADPGWGGTGKSSDEVWADVFCERAELALAIAYVGEEKGTNVMVNSERIRESVEHFEQCLMFFPNHARGIIGLSNVLLDFYEKKVELGRRVDDGKPKEDVRERTKRSAVKVSNDMQNGIAAPAINMDRRSSATNPLPPGSLLGSNQTDEELKKTPENLNRLAARDRAYGLLSTLTKLGTGWDDSEAWFALARAHELGGEIDKAKEVLWWCVELEDRRPIRHWRNVSCSGYVL